MSIFEVAETLTEQHRAEALDSAQWLSSRILGVQIDAGFDLVEGEAGPAYAGEALGRLVSGRSKREGGGPVSQIEAWLQAEVAAASVAAAHEFETAEPVSSDEQNCLREAFASFGQQAE